MGAGLSRVAVSGAARDSLTSVGRAAKPRGENAMNARTRDAIFQIVIAAALGIPAALFVGVLAYALALRPFHIFQVTSGVLFVFIGTGVFQRVRFAGERRVPDEVRYFGRSSVTPTGRRVHHV
jgi:hypothetical protein